MVVVPAAPIIAGSGGISAGASAGPVLSAIGTGLSALSAVQSGRATSAQSKFQAAVMQQQADRERQIAEAQAKDFQRDQSRLMAKRRAIGGASGVDMSTGSPLLATEDFAGEIELQRQRILNSGETSATRLEQSAGLERLRGRNAQTGGYMRAGSLLLTGAGRSFKS